MVIEFQSSAEFDAAIGDTSNSLLIIEFFATWCDACKHIEPKLAEFDGKYNDITFRSADVDKLQNLAQRIGIRATPTFLFFKSGKKVLDLCGGDFELLEKLILENLSLS